jgi:hypothetical protein
MYQTEPAGLPRLIERDYVHPMYPRWCDQQLSREGFDSSAVALQYVAADATLSPIRDGLPPFRFPFLIMSSFKYHGLRIFGPFVAGHQAGISMVQSSAEQQYARFHLPAELSGVFTSDLQTQIIASVMSRIVSHPAADGVVAALPDRGRDPVEYLSSNIARVLTGGHIADVANGVSMFTPRPGNRLRGVPFKLTPNVFGDTSMPLFADDFTFYSFLPARQHQDLLRDDTFLRILSLVRRLGPMFKNDKPDLSEGLLFDPVKNVAFLAHLFRVSAYGS